MRAPVGWLSQWFVSGRCRFMQVGVVGVCCELAGCLRLGGAESKPTGPEAVDGGKVDQGRTIDIVRRLCEAGG